MIRTKLIVAEYQKALIYTNGRYVRTVGAGRHVLWHPWLRQSAVVFDMRKQSVSLVGQEILSKDRVPVRLTLAATYQVSDPAAAQHKVENWAQQIYLDLQLALRELVAGLLFDELLDQKTSLGDRLCETVRPRTAEYGVDLLAAGVKDVTMPASIREMMLKTVEAEKSAQASLIRAREEVAAARARANAAKLIAENPAVLRLKELDTLADVAKSPGSTIVFASGLDWNGLAKGLAARGNGSSGPAAE
jgi:regulator of protease activity HflC (stomatin/prohibitin superfamily)